MRVFLITILCLIPLNLVAVTAEFDFTGNVSEQRYLNYIAKIRCLMCQNESLASSRAELAVDLREEIYKMMADGQSNKQISDFLVQRYGDFVLYQPPLRTSTLALWVGPFIFLVALFLLLIRRVNKMQKTPVTSVDAETKKQAIELLKEPQKR